MAAPWQGYIDTARNGETVAHAQALLLTCAVGDVIRTLGSIPSGVLYARVMDRLSLREFEAIVGALKGAGLVEERAHMLTWIGPAVQA